LAKVGHEPNLEPRQIAARRSSSKGTSEDAQEHGSPFERIQNSLKGAIVYTQKSSIFRFGDPPYPHVDTSFISLPPVLEARQMVVGFFENVAPTIHFLHLPSVNTWLNEMTEGYKDNPANPVEPSKRAVIFMLLAIMQSHKNVQSSAVNSDLRYDLLLAPMHLLISTALFISNLRKCSWTPRQVKPAYRPFKPDFFSASSCYRDLAYINVGPFLEPLST
jgi:hypothetical protein